MRNISGKICRENENTHFMLNNFYENLTFYEITWKNIVEPDRLQTTIRHISIACWIPKAADTHSECVKYLFSTATMVERKCLIVTLYTHCLSCYFYERIVTDSMKEIYALENEYIPYFNKGCCRCLDFVYRVKIQ
jgi:hypothetical protein